MKVTSNPIRDLIKQRIKSDGEDSEDLTYVDVFSPKLITLIGTEGCMKIYEGKDPVEAFANVGLTKEDYESILAVISEGMRISSLDDSLETLNEIDKRSVVMLRGYLIKVRNFKIKFGASLSEIEKFDKAVENFFKIPDYVKTTPCSEYEKTIADKNNVK